MIALTKELEDELRMVLKDYWDSYIRGDIPRWASYLPDHYRNIGTTEAEVWNSKQEILHYTNSVIDQLAGLADIRDRVVSFYAYDPYIMAHEIGNMYLKTDTGWNYYGKLRLSSLLEKTTDGWKILHQHGSFPDTIAEKGETFGFEGLNKENAELRDAVKRRTAELELKNRELEIESSLERVRAESLGMNHAEDMLKVCKIISLELKSLGLKEIRNIQTAIFNTEKGTYMNYEYYLRHGKEVITEVNYSNENVHGAQLDFVRAMLSGEGGYYTRSFEGQELTDWYHYQKGTEQLADEYLLGAHSLNYYMYSLGSVTLGISTYYPMGENDLKLFERCRNVFKLAYRRYLDIQEASLQRREAEVQLALERVRARTMAMQHSDELSDASFLLDSQVRALGIKTRGCAFNIYGENESTEWFSSEDGTFPVYPTPRENIFLRYYEAGQAGKAMHIQEFSGEACAAHYEFLCTLPVMGAALMEMKKAGVSFPVRQIDHVVYFKYGYLLFITFEPAPEAHDIFLRFAKVFEQTYTRFLDLEMAEAQAREAQIGAALERVRSRTMGMQKSDELKEIIKVVYEQIVQLNIHIEHSGFIMDYKERDDMHIWLADEHMTPFQINIPYFDSPHWNSFLHAREKGNDFFSNLLDFDTKNKFYRDLFERIPELPAETRDYYFSCPGLAISTVLLDNVGLYIENFSGIPYTEEENNTLMRFGKVFQQTYTRFLDLQRAEAQAKESQIEAALERVRSRTLAMQKSEELAETAAVLFRQLIQLGIAPNRLYIALIKTDDGQLEFWVTDEDGSKVSKRFTGDANRNASMKNMYAAWLSGKKSITMVMEGPELSDYFNYLANDLQVPFKDGLRQKKRIQSIAYFGKGFIGIASPEEQPEETLRLLERFAAVFNLTYTRFNDLKIAEAHALQAEEDLIKLQTEKRRAEEALSDLRMTQTQLIQAEKMASLGELTAGIAHEIQNPLNFVNNFSEVSTELMDEMMEEVTKGNFGEVKSIVADLKQNLEKINHHGKRADGIVKGMLQHSRTSSGQMEPTDINALVDEYLRLAYHGIRAKDKTFNATLQTEFDQSIGVVNMVPQDMGRVILNLITNAFHAVSARALTKAGKYQPTVTVSTKKETGQLVIRVKDNGTGIPIAIREKVFQPFFTTKPTGQGTGLGLSLAYDIVKAHGGELRMESEEGIGTVMSICMSG